MNPEKQDFLRHRMARAHETLEDARLMLEQGHLHSVVNRIYYACFYMVSALLFTEGLSSSKHIGVRSLFNRHWIKTKRLPVEMSQFYRDIFNLRQQGDYVDLTSFARDDVETWLEEATDFIAQISQEIEKLLDEGEA
jgi:uncharacterized protein (UPF0332 family)